MKILLCGDIDVAERARWRTCLEQAGPEFEWLTPDDPALDRTAVDAAVVANPPPGSLAGCPRLRLIQSLWAGVDRLLADTTLPEGVPVARMVDPVMTIAMGETALWAVLSLHRGYFDYQRQQRSALWLQHAQRRADEVPVLVLGHGQMGRAVAETLARRGYPVHAWRLRASGAAHAPGAAVTVVQGREGLTEAMRQALILINLLPLTAQTRGLLDARFYARLPAGASIVNLARGGHVVEADLLDALDAGHLHHAVLDVFQSEPLPSEHPFWTHPAVTVLPHAAALTDPRSAAAVAVANLRALRSGEPLQHVVERARGY
jgi:glyoxylate/hydroxypyruvate reductase A